MAVGQHGARQNLPGGSRCRLGGIAVRFLGLPLSVRFARARIGSRLAA